MLSYISKAKERFINSIIKPNEKTDIYLKDNERLIVNKINNLLAKGEKVHLKLNNTSQLSTLALEEIADLSKIKFTIYSGFNDLDGNLKPKYNNAKYINRVTYNGNETLAISRKLDELSLKIDFNLSVREKAYQIYKILSSEIPTVNINEENKDIVTSLRGLTNINNTGKEGLICSGYSQAYKELCTRNGITCDYIRGIGYCDKDHTKGSGPHAWNVVIDGDIIIPVDVMFNAVEGTEWFGSSAIFQQRHFADVDERYKIYAPTNMRYDTPVPMYNQQLPNSLPIKR